MINNLAKVISINISSGGIPKRPIDEVMVYYSGLQADGHNHSKHYRLEQAVSLQDHETLQQLRHEGFPLMYGSTGENINIYGIAVNDLPIGAVLNFSGGLKLEITKIRQPCYVLDQIDPELKTAILGRCGMYARVLKEAVLKNQEIIEVLLPQQSLLVALR